MYRRCVTALRLLRPVNIALAIQGAEFGFGRSAVADGIEQLNQTGAQFIAIVSDLGQLLLEPIALGRHGGEHLAGVSPGGNENAATVMPHRGPHSCPAILM
jgi:hypothetical protein